MQKTKIRAIQFLKTGKDAAKMLDFVHKTFHQMTLSIQPFIVLPQDFSPLVGWNDGVDAPLEQKGNKILSRIATIRDQLVKIKAFEQGIGLGDVMALSCRQQQAQRVAQRIHRHMDFTAKAAPTTAKRLFTVFFRFPPRRDVRAR